MFDLTIKTDLKKKFDLEWQIYSVLKIKSMVNLVMR